MDKEAFANVVLSSTDSLYRISKSILKNDADCEDAVQEAIATGFGKLSTLRQEAYARTWLTRILIYECYSLLKKREKTAAMLAEPQDEECASSDYSDLYDALSTLKKGVPSDDRAVLSCHSGKSECVHFPRQQIRLFIRRRV